MAEGAMNDEQIQAAAEGDPLIVDMTVKQQVQWEKSKGMIIGQNEDGAFRIEKISCSQEEYEELRFGKKIRVFGLKGAQGEELVIDQGKVELLD